MSCASKPHGQDTHYPIYLRFSKSGLITGWNLQEQLTLQINHYHGTRTRLHPLAALFTGTDHRAVAEAAAPSGEQRGGHLPGGFIMKIVHDCYSMDLMGYGQYVDTYIYI